MPDKNRPLISVIMPAYNAAAFISDAIASVIAQTWQEWELIVIDDGSTDDTPMILASTRDPRVRRLHKSNGGVSSARNMGLDHARGEYVAFLDADDLLPPRSLASRMEVMLADPKVHFVDGTVFSFSDSDPEGREIYRPAFRGQPFSRLLELGNDLFFGCTWMYRRTPRNTATRFPLMTHAEDLAFYLLIAREGLYSYTNEPVLYYRRGHGSAMSNLHGLEQGYHQFYKIAASLEPPPPPDKLLLLRKRIGSIMFRSYLKAGRPVAAIRSWIKTARSGS
jgi:teichuronic acid biosynthesis glycosyltransferase TuaG